MGNKNKYSKTVEEQDCKLNNTSEICKLWERNGGTCKGCRYIRIKNINNESN